MNALRQFITHYRFKRQLEQRLAARKLLRPQRSQAALKGWDTRRRAS